MSKSFRVSLRIAAPPPKIWDVLANLSKWTSWNSTVDKIEGTVELGGKVVVHAKASPGRAFPLKVSELDPPRRMVWSGGMPLGLFTGRRTYSIASHPQGGSNFEMVEEFTGLMAPLITRSIPDLQPSFDEFANCLKLECEKA